jgi:hypothetical protein
MINEAALTVDGKHVTIRINTRKGTKIAFIDAADLDKVKQLDRIVLYKDPKGRPMARSGKDNGQVLLHRHLFDIPKGSRLVWKNDDTLDLRRSNLQLVDRQGNVTELQPKDPNNTYEILKSAAVEGIPAAKKIVEKLEPKKNSNVRGVYFHKASQRWHASAFYEGKRYSLGYFQYEYDAVKNVNIFRAEGPDSPLLKRNQPKGDN